MQEPWMASVGKEEEGHARRRAPGLYHWHCVRYLIHEKGLNQEGLRRLLALIPCWEIRDCPPDAMAECLAPSDRSTPCWDLARRSGNGTRACHACQVYLSAWDHVLDKAEHEEALRYGLAG
jgi:MerR family transcriptional regulator/heat shock protein HspR